MQNIELFPFDHEPSVVRIGPQAMVLRGFALDYVDALLPIVDGLADSFRNMVTPGGVTMSVASTNVGRFGWVTDRRGYRYTEVDPKSGSHWLPMPIVFQQLATQAAGAAGFTGFEPDACLVNRYLPGTRLTLHQDRNERDFDAPIVSVSLGIPAVFLFGGKDRTDKSTRVLVAHGDVIVWGGVDRLNYHGILPLKDASHPLLGACRINLTFRKAGA